MTQIFALDSSKRLVSIYQAEDQKNYYCRECGGVLRTRGGIHRQKHFFHLRLSPSCRQSEKSLEHLQVQYTLMNLLPDNECFLERQFPKVGRIADVVWEGQKLVFEVQCSGISKEEVEARNRDYASIGYQVVWILHEKTFNRWRVSAAESYLRDHPHYYTNMDKSGKGIFYDQIAGYRGGVRRVFQRLPGVLLNQPKRNDNRRKVRPGRSIYFAGDLVDCLVKSENSIEVVLLRAQQFEGVAGKAVLPYLEYLKEWTYRLVVRPYLLVFQMFLEKACR